jgi:hypothetical protein
MKKTAMTKEVRIYLKDPKAIQDRTVAYFESRTGACRKRPGQTDR